jgi:hypothetical protein
LVIAHAEIATWRDYTRNYPEWFVFYGEEDFLPYLFKKIGNSLSAK